jgi:hypothetical protein
MGAVRKSQSNYRHLSRIRALRWASITLALTLGLGLRLWMLSNFFLVNGDSLIYGEIAKNLLLHGQYAVAGVGEQLNPTLIRLPGYPYFLALCFRLFGMENYASATWVQIALELAGCLLLADFARRIAPSRLGRGAAHATLWLAALCPFTAIYTVEPLTESPTLFGMALGLWSVARFRERPGWLSALCFTVAVTIAALLRPDGALLAVALVPALLFRVKRGEGKPGIKETCWIRMTLVCTLLALTPFAAWTWRNWQVFHVVQPLAPRSASDPGQETYPGWEHWVKTWSLDFVSTFDIYWAVPGDKFDLGKLPNRAFDSAQQYVETASLTADYNATQALSPILDARFERLAEERIRSHPVRSYLWLPLGRLADMWLRPRVENIFDDLDWWAYARHPQKTMICWAYAGLNALYLLMAALGLWCRPRVWPWMVAYLALRSGLLLTIEAPEARYTLESFPMLFALAGIGLLEGWRKITGRIRLPSGYSLIAKLF